MFILQRSTDKLVLIAHKVNNNNNTNINVHNFIKTLLQKQKKKLTHPLILQQEFFFLLVEL